MDVTLGTFNLNNLFGRWNLYVEAAPPPTRASVSREARPAARPATTPPRDWLAEAPALEARPGARGRASLPDVRVIIEGDVTPAGIKWRTNPYTGKVVYQKTEAARKALAKRIKAIDVDVLALQEVENIEALEAFVDEGRLRDYKHLVLVEGNDERLIDVGVISRLPIGAVTSWRHRTYQNERGRPVFSRDLLQVEVLAEDRKRLLFTLFVNHLKSKLAQDEKERRDGNRRRRRQAEAIAAVIGERPPQSPYVVLGDMTTLPTPPGCGRCATSASSTRSSTRTRPAGRIRPTIPTSRRRRPWTHRYRARRRTDYELFDQIWLTPDLATKQTGAWIHRRTTREGDATDHDSPYVGFSL